MDIISFKNRKLDLYKPVRVYRNLNKKGVWYSVKQFGVVIGHTNQLLITDVKFIINQKIRTRVLATSTKEVHAFVEGYIDNSYFINYNTGYSITYNPYIKSFFYKLDSGDEVKSEDCHMINFSEEGVRVLM